MRSQVKTKERVRQHGEVFTAEREVMAMMDLVKEDASNIDSTFFEPACGDGNFLAEILSRKMRSVFKVALSNDADCEYWAILIRVKEMRRTFFHKNTSCHRKFYNRRCVLCST